MQGLQGTGKAQDSVPANHKPGQEAVPETTTTPPRRFIMQALPLLSSPDVKRRDPVSPRHVKKAKPWCPRPALTRIPGPPRT